MKKTTRLLALVLAVIMTMSTMSVMSSAYSAFKWNGTDDVSLNYDDADTASFTTSQYASMALDEVDRMLVDAGLGEIDLLGMATLELDSVDGAIKSVSSLVGQLSDALSMLGDASLLKEPLNNLATVSRSMAASDNQWAKAANNYSDDTAEGADSDLLVIYSVLDLLGCSQIGQVIEKYADGSLTVGMLDSAIASYKFDIRGIALSALIKVAETYELDEYGNLDDWDIIDDLSRVTDTSTQFYKDYYTVGTQENQYKTGALLIANQALTKFVLGDWTKLTASNTYEGGNKTCETVWGDYYWKEYVDGKLVPTNETEPDFDTYDYYGFVHPDGWVTFGLGDAIRVEKDSTAPSASYTCVDLAAAKYNIKKGTMTGYDFIENLIVQAYNGIAVPVLNRLVVKWLHEKMGYEFLTYKEEKYYDDLSTEDKAKAKKGALDTEEGKYLNASYDYCYLGEESKVEGANVDRLMNIFNDGTIEIKRYTPVTGQTFVQNLNSTLGEIVEQALAVGQNEPLTRTADDGLTEISATWSWVTTENTAAAPFADNGNLFKNLCSLVRFVLEYTENDFFGTDAINRGEIKDFDWLSSNATATNGDQKLLAYILRVILNSSIDEIYIVEEDNESLGTVAYHLVEQWAYTINPYLSYTMPTAQDIYTESYNTALLNKMLVMLLDIASNALNMDLDANVDETATKYNNHNQNKKGTNTTGQLGYIGDSSYSYKDENNETKETSYTMANLQLSGTLQSLTTWALKIYAPILSMYDQTSYTKVTNFWEVLDTVVNNIIPLHTMTSGGTAKTVTGLLDEDIYNNRTSGYTGIQELLFNYLLLPILNLDSTGKIFKLFDKGTETAFSGTQDFEQIIITILALVFDDLFPYAYDWTTMTDLDAIMNNSNISGFLKRVLNNLSVHSSFTGADNKSHLGRGRNIAYVALPLVCMILDLSDSQEFGELENLIDGTITTKDTSFQIFNGTSGINSSYLDSSANRVIDKPYNYTGITASITNVTDTTNKSATISLDSTTLAPGKFADYSIDNVKEGSTYAITFKYSVTDETGGYLAEDLQSTTYVYVGTEQSTVGTKTYANGTLSYTTDIYTTGGLSTGWGFSYKNNKEDSTTSTVTVKSVSLTDPNDNAVSGFGLSSDTADTTYTVNASTSSTVSPFAYAEGANFQRTKYVYKTDENDKVVYDENYGLAVVDHVMTSNEYLAANKEAKSVTWLPNGIYTLTTTIDVDGTSQSVTQYIHMYEEYGLEDLFNNEVGKNYTFESFTSATQANFTDYSTALKNTAGFVLAPKVKGASGFNPTTKVKTAGDTGFYLPETYGNGTAFVNAYQQYYAYLYKAINSVTPASAGATDIYNLLKTMVDVNEYESQDVTIGESTITANFLKENREYYTTDDEGNYVTKFVAQMDYAGTYYNTFRDAMHEAEDIIARDQSYNGVNITYEDYDAITDEATKDYWDAQILAWSKWEGKGTIGSTEAAIVKHKLDTAWKRLASYKLNFSHDDAVAKLKTAQDTYGLENEPTAYTTKSYNNFSNAYAFATATIANKNATLDQITTAYRKYIQAYKELAPTVDKAPLVAFVYNVVTGGAIDEEETEFYAQYFNSEVYDIATVISASDDVINEVYESYVNLADNNYEAMVIDGETYKLYDGQPFYTMESYQKFITALYEAAKYCPKETEYELDSVDQRDSLIKDITDAIAGLERYKVDTGYSFTVISNDPTNWTTEQMNAIAGSEYSFYDEEEGTFYGYSEYEEFYWVPEISFDIVRKYDDITADYFYLPETPDGVNEDEAYLWPTVAYDDETTVNLTGYVVGVAPHATEADIAAIFGNPQNCKVVVKAAQDDEGEDTGYGTGTVVFITSEDGSTIYEAYEVVYRSDVTGDCAYDGKDDKQMNLEIAGMICWEEDPSTMSKYIAGDINGDNVFDAEDQACLMYYVAGMERNGVNYADIWQPSGNNNIPEE